MSNAYRPFWSSSENAWKTLSYQSLEGPGRLSLGFCTLWRSRSQLANELIKKLCWYLFRPGHRLRHLEVWYQCHHQIEWFLVRRSRSQWEIVFQQQCKRHGWLCARNQHKPYQPLYLPLDSSPWQRVGGKDSCHNPLRSKLKTHICLPELCGCNLQTDKFHSSLSEVNGDVGVLVSRF